MPFDRLNHLDLCSGIGGFALGFEWAELSNPIGFCDIDKWCRQILAQHWPDVPVYDDVKEIANGPERFIQQPIDILTAGYPCQPFSLAGKRQGEEDDRHIWPHIFRIVTQQRPTWCVFENVYGHISMGLDNVLLDLEAEGYATRTFVVPACGIKALHKRDRVWIVAYSESNQEDGELRTTQPKYDKGDTWLESECSNNRQPGGTTSQDVADTSKQGWEGIPQESLLWESDLSQQSRRSCANFGELWSVEPNVGRVADGVPKRVDRLKGLGNAIVPQIAMQIGLAIKSTYK